MKPAWILFVFIPAQLANATVIIFSFLLQTQGPTGVAVLVWLSGLQPPARYEGRHFGTCQGLHDRCPFPFTLEKRAQRTADSALSDLPRRLQTKIAQGLLGWLN